MSNEFASLFFVELFYYIIDVQLLELNGRFHEAKTKRILFVACLCPTNSFSFYYKQKGLSVLLSLILKNFYHAKCLKLDNQLKTYIFNVRSNVEFSHIRGLGDFIKYDREKERIGISIFVHQTCICYSSCYRCNWKSIFNKWILWRIV